MEERLGVAGVEDAERKLCGAPPACTEDVLRPQRMPVPGIAGDIPELDQPVECTAKRLTADAQASLQFDEPRTAALSEQRESRWRPPVMEEMDQVFG